MLFRVLKQRPLFRRWIIRDCLISPDLTMGMWIAGAHHLAAILEDLNVIDPVDRTQLLVLFAPDLDYSSDLVKFHIRNSEVVARRKTNHTADAAFPFCNYQVGLVHFAARTIRLQCCIIVLEHKRAAVPGISVSTGP